MIKISFVCSGVEKMETSIAFKEQEWLMILRRKSSKYINTMTNLHMLLLSHPS